MSLRVSREFSACRDVLRPRGGLLEIKHGLIRPDTIAVMPVPDYQSLMRPTLQALADDALTRRQVQAAVARAVDLTAEELAELLPSGKATLLASRTGWALTYMQKAGLVERPRRGQYLITTQGRSALIDNPGRIDNRVLAALSPAFSEYVSQRGPRPETGATPSIDDGFADRLRDETLSPEEAIPALVAAADEVLSSDLLSLVYSLPPEFLERLSLRLLRAMGYGGGEGLLEHTGRSGDRGLDGLIRQDSLGLDLVGVQAKRYDPATSVGRPEIQAFVGALQGAQTQRGVFITTARFAPSAIDYADTVGLRLVLISGAELTRLMVRYNVGVSVRDTFELKQVDAEFFED